MSNGNKKRMDRLAIQATVAHALLPFLPGLDESYPQDPGEPVIDLSSAAGVLRELANPTTGPSDEAGLAYRALATEFDAVTICWDDRSLETTLPRYQGTLRTPGGAELRIGAACDGAVLELRCQILHPVPNHLLIGVEDELESPVALLPIRNWQEHRFQLVVGTDLLFDPTEAPWQIRLLEIPRENVISVPIPQPGRIIWLLPTARRDERTPGFARVREATLPAASGRTRLAFESPEGPWAIDVETYAGGANGFVRISGRLPPAITGDVALEIRPDADAEPQTRRVSVADLRKGIKIGFSDLGFDPIEVGWCVRVGRTE